MTRRSGAPWVTAATLSLAVTLFLAAATVLLLGPAAAQALEPSGDAAAPMYRPDNVDVVYLTLPPASETALNADPDEYVEGTFSLAETDGSPNGVGPASAPLTVGIRLKGQLGSKRSLAQKAAFKIKFSWVKGQKFLGLKKMTLNNMVQDPSGIHEALTYGVFRAAGVAASRTGYAYVYVNGVDYGLHLNLENVDDVATEKRVGDFQHVYEGAYGSDVETGAAPTPAEITTAAERFEVDEGDEDDLGDLEALIASVNSSAAGDWSQRLEALADLKQMTRMWAVEKYVGHWDGYAGIQGSGYQPNNFYLQSDGAGWFRMLPWGVDQTWADHLGFDGAAGVLFDACLGDASCAEMYRRSLRDVQAVTAAGALDDLATELAALIQPWVEEEQANSRHEFSLGQFQSAVQGTRNFISSRPAELASWLAGQPPQVPATQISLELDQSSVVADGVAVVTATATVADADDNPIPGDDLSFSSTDAGHQLGPVLDNDDGTYSVQIRSSVKAGAATITATDDSTAPDLVATAPLAQVAGPAAQVALALQPASIPADGSSIATAVATVSDAHGNPLAADSVGFSSTDPGQVLGAATVHGDGTYSVPIVASTSAGAVTITATDSSVSPGVSGAATLNQVALGGPGTPTTGSDGSGAGAAEPGLIPSAVLLAKPRHRTHDRRPTFRFASSDPSAHFRCQLDDQRYRACTSPLTLPKLTWGHHTLRVKAIGPSGESATATTYAFTITRRHPNPR